MNQPMTTHGDRQELAKFADLAVHWWEPTGPLKTLHQINPIRLYYIEEKLPLSDQKVIDIGCGGGILTEGLAQKGAHVTGIDMNKPVIDIAKLHQLESKTTVEYLHASAEEIAAKRPGYYDMVTCFELLEHVSHPAAIIHHCAALVKLGGHLFFSTLNRHLKSYLFAILGAEYMLNWLPKNTHDYAKFIRPAELCAWLRQAHLTPEEVRGLSYRPMSQQFELSRDVSINYLCYARRFK
jgi:2-polyprenyl-6-hydroxyphenyl methylase / 3-demethylubiquinone-9 3-methyltransferase